MQTPRQRIAEIDKLIDAKHAELLRRYGKKPRAASGWQKAWDAHPDLDAREHELYSQRGAAQLERDDADHREAMKAARAETRKFRTQKPTPCPTCGQATFAVSA